MVQRSEECKDGGTPLGGVVRKPACSCFADDNILGDVKSTLAARKTAEGLLQNMIDRGLCKDALPYVMDMTVVSMAACVALYGTAIDHNSQEAVWEIERVLTGIEQRAKALVKHMKNTGAES